MLKVQSLNAVFFYSWSEKFAKLHDERDSMAHVVMILQLAKVKYFNDNMQTPLLSNAKSSKFNTVDTISFNIDETSKSVDGSSKGNESNGYGKGNSKTIESDRGDYGSGKRTIIDLDDYDEYEAKAKRVKKVVRDKVEPKD
nr:replication protein A 70 kDa DNA-binding subunit B [Tanacetum cinerariifolium]